MPPPAARAAGPAHQKNMRPRGTIFCQVNVLTPRNFLSSAAAAASTGTDGWAVACTFTARRGSWVRPFTTAAFCTCAQRGVPEGQGSRSWEGPEEEGLTFHARGLTQTAKLDWLVNNRRGDAADGRPHWTNPGQCAGPGAPTAPHRWDRRLTRGAETAALLCVRRAALAAKGRLADSRAMGRTGRAMRAPVAIAMVCVWEASQTRGTEGPGQHT